MIMIQISYNTFFFFFTENKFPMISFHAIVNDDNDYSPPPPKKKSSTADFEYFAKKRKVCFSGSSAFG